MRATSPSTKEPAPTQEGVMKRSLLVFVVIATLLLLVAAPAQASTASLQAPAGRHLALRRDGLVRREHDGGRRRQSVRFSHPLG